MPLSYWCLQQVWEPWSCKSKKTRLIQDGSSFDPLYSQGKGKDGSDTFVKLPIEVTDAINEYLHLRNDKNKHIFVSHEKTV